MQKINRRELLRRAAIGSASVAALLGHKLTAHASDADPEVQFRLLALGDGPTEGAIFHRIVMAGEGVIKESEVGRESAPIEIAEGGGSFQHYDANSPRPRTILTSGSWKVKRLLSARFIGTWGQFTAGIVELEVELHTSSSLVIPATMKIVHNIIGPAGLDTGQTDGYTLTPVGSSFPIFKTAPPTGPVTAGLATEFVIKRKD